MDSFDELEDSNRRRDDESEASEPFDDDDDTELLEGFRDFNWGNGEQYRGEWTNNLMQGRGKFTCPKGTYQGKFFAHQMHGKGRFDFKGGGSYFGQYVEGRREGEGIMSYPDQSVYEGAWENNMRHGWGTIQFSNQDMYEGEWVEDVRTGEGVYVCKTKAEVFKGVFKGNKREGTGDLWLLDPEIPDYFHRYLVEYTDGVLKRKRSRPTSDVPWPQGDPWAAWEEAKFVAIDTGEDDYVARQAEAADAAREVLLKGLAGGGRAATAGSDDDDNDDMLFGNKNVAMPKRLASAGDDDLGSLLHQDSLAGLDDTKFKRKSALMKFLCCDAGPDAVSVPGRRMSVSAPKSAERSRRGRQYKTDTVVVVRVYKAQYLPAAGKVPVDTFVAARIGSNQQAGDLVKDSLDPVYSKKFEFELPDIGRAGREVVLRVHRVPKSGDVEVVGKIVLDLDGKSLGFRSEMMNHFLTSEDGNKPIMGRDEKGRKIGSQLRLTYDITLIKDALLTVFVDRCHSLRGVDPTTFSSPYIKVIYGDIELSTKPAKKNYEDPQFECFLSFEAHTLEALQRLDRKPVLNPGKMIIECWEYFMFGSHVYLGSFEVELSKQKFGRANVTKMSHDFKDPDRPAKSIGRMDFSLVWGSNEMTSLRVNIQEGYKLPKHAFGTPGPRPGIKTARGMETAPLDMDSSVTVILDPQLNLIQKSKVMVQNLNPEYNEDLWFSIKQNELPTSLTVQVMENRAGLAGTKQYLVGQSEFDLTALMLDGLPIKRWCRMDHPDLMAAIEEIDRRADREKRMLRAMQKGEDFQVEEEQDDEAANIEATFLGRLLGKRAQLLRRETDAAKAKRKVQATVKAIEGGVDPFQQGRVRVQVQWLSVPDEEDIAVQEMWDETMKEPKNRKIVKRLIVAWSHETMKRAFQAMSLSTQQGMRDKHKAWVFFTERCLPKHHRAWTRRVKAKRDAKSCAKFWSFRNRLQPCFYEWNLAIIEGANEKRLEKGKPLRKATGYAEAVIQAPMDINEGVFAQFDQHARPARLPLEFKGDNDSWAIKKSDQDVPSRVPKKLRGDVDLSQMI